MEAVEFAYVNKRLHGDFHGWGPARRATPTHLSLTVKGKPFHDTVTDAP